MSYRNILSDRVDRVALITLNRPEKLNAMSYELACELDEELTKLEIDDDIRAIVRRVLATPEADASLPPRTHAIEAGYGHGV